MHPATVLAILVCVGATDAQQHDNKIYKWPPSPYRVFSDNKNKPHSYGLQEKEIQESGTQESNTQEPDTQESGTQESNTQEPDTQESNTQEPDTQEYITQESNTQETNTQETNTQETNTQETNTQETNTQETNTQETNTQETNTQETNTQESNTQEPDTQKYNTQESNTQETNTQESNTQETNTQESNTQESNTQETNTQETNTQETNTQESNTQESNTQESNTQKTDAHEPDTEESEKKRSHRHNFDTQVQKFNVYHQNGRLRRPYWIVLKPIKSLRPTVIQKKVYPNHSQDSNDSSSSESLESEATPTTTEVNVPQKPWVAPPYYQALKYFEAALENIQSHFRREAHTYKDDNNFRFIVIAVVVDGLSRHVLKIGWKYYDDNYESLVISLSKKAIVNPQESVEMIRCAFRRASNSIQKIKALINNEWTQYICKAQPASCNSIIFAHVKTCGDDQLKPEADLILKLGDAAGTYLRSYANVFDVITGQNAYLYIVDGKENIRELVEKNAMVLDVLYPNGVPSRSCVSSHKYRGLYSN